MRKRLFLRLVPLCGLLLSLLACASIQGEQTAGEQTYLLYFREADLAASAGGDVFQTEAVSLEEGLDLQGQAAALMEALLAGPESELLRSTLPAGTFLLSVKVEGRWALVDFSRAYSTLSGVRLTMADYAVALTLTQLPGIALVRITVQGQMLPYQDNQVFTAHDVLLSSEEDVVGTADATLYFLNEDGVLTGERRTLELYEGDTQALAVARALEAGPETRGLLSSLPEGFRVKTIWLEEDICYVNLPPVLPSGEDAAPETALQALSLSLCSLDTVSEVHFLVDGEFTRLYGGADVSKPFAAYSQIP